MATSDEIAVRNKFLWFYGADNGSTGYEVILEQHGVEDPSHREWHTIFKIEPGGDATAIGMLIGSLQSGVAGANAYHTEHDPRSK